PCQNPLNYNFDIKDIDLISDIEFNNVHFSYPSRLDIKILNSLSFSIKRGETLALLGSSGCGKSTIVQLLLRFYEPLSGEIRIDGRLIHDYNLQWLRQNIGVVNQEPILFGTTILENIRYGNDDSTIDDIIDAAKTANAHDFIIKFPNRYQTLVGEHGAQLSGGQKQRICIARALVNNPKIVIFDEASSALDSQNEKIVHDALAEACKGRTTIIIAHRLSTIRNANKICIIDNGCIIEQGDHETLMMNKDGKYYSIVKLQESENINKDISNEEQELDGEVIVHDRRRSSNSSITDKTAPEQKKTSSNSVTKTMLKLNSQEWPYILIGCFACLCNGTVQPVYALLISKLLK
ncbi:unnamed protein product, partial [Didymodactylos carnosus]